MKPIDEPYGLCSIDPISLTGLVLAGAAGAAGTAAASGAFSGGGASSAAAPTPAAPPAPAAAAPAQQQPTGQRAGNAGANTPSFVGSAAVPSQVGYGQKSLLGQ